MIKDKNKDDEHKSNSDFDNEYLSNKFKQSPPQIGENGMVRKRSGKELWKIAKALAKNESKINLAANVLRLSR